MTRVVILGAGFAGLYLARGLARLPVQVTIVDRQNHHLFQPMLYQIAMAALSPSNIASPIRSILRRQRNAEVLLDEAVAVDAQARTVTLHTGQRLAWDVLAVATGARHSYFGHAAWEPLAPGLKSLDDALEIRRRVLLAFERAERESDPVRRRALLTFVIVGAGPTGVELAGALAEMRRYALRRDFRHIDSRDATVVLLEGGPRVLPSYPEPLSQRAREDLQALGVEVCSGTFVTNITEDGVEAGALRLPTCTVVWAAGNEASPFLEHLHAPRDPQGRILVTPECTVPGHPDIFVLGDAAAFTHQEDLGILPGVCPVAIQMGRYAASMIGRDVAGRPRVPFRYTNKGQLAVIGRGNAVADVAGRFRFAGFPAWLAWVFIHIFFLIGFRNRLLVMIEWAWSYLTFQRGARLITGLRTPASPEDE